MANPSYSRNVQPLFNQYCSQPSCHADLPGAGNLNLTEDYSYDQLVNVAALIPVTCISGTVTVVASARVSGSLSDPYRSVLIHRLEATCNTLPRMPSGIPPLEKAQVDIIRNWILSGAPHN